MRLAITDSGLGGLAVCAALERRLRAAGALHSIRLLYVNVWPDEACGYNSLPDMPARAAMFDRALAAIDALAPDRLVIACNTLSILYELTEHGRQAPFPVTGIVEPGVTLFHEALTARPRSGIVLVGTRTTIESGAHRQRLVRLGVDAHRIASVPCHGLAGAIEADPAAPGVTDLIEHCAEEAADKAPDGEPLHAGLCCTHYGYVAEAIRTALARHTGRQVLALDPNDRLVDLVVASIAADADGEGGATPGVEVISKVRLENRRRHALAHLVEPVSPATAAALISYAHVPDLF